VDNFVAMVTFVETVTIALM